METIRNPLCGYFTQSVKNKIQEQICNYISRDVTDYIIMEYLFTRDIYKENYDKVVNNIRLIKNESLLAKRLGHTYWYQLTILLNINNKPSHLRSSIFRLYLTIIYHDILF